MVMDLKFVMKQANSSYLWMRLGADTATNTERYRILYILPSSITYHHKIKVEQKYWDIVDIYDVYDEFGNIDHQKILIRLGNDQWLLY